MSEKLLSQEAGYTMVHSRHHAHTRLTDEGNTFQSSTARLITEMGRESSAPALRKVMTSRGSKRKFIWTLMVIVGLAATSLHLWVLVHKYLEFQVVERSEVKSSMEVEFPSVTICNLEPVSMDKIRIGQQLGEFDTLMDWLAFTEHYHFTHDFHVNSFRAFYENVKEEVMKSNHDLQTMLLYCRFDRNKCSFKNFTHFFDGNYFSCYTFNGDQLKDRLKMRSTGPESGLSLIISVEKGPQIPGTYGIYNFQDNYMFGSGFRVVVHAPGSLPSPVDHGFDIPPGYSSSVGIRPLLHTRLSEPYGNCTKKTLDGLQTFRNTFSACLRLCKQRQMIERCGCKSSALPDLQENIAFCGVIPDWQEKWDSTNRTYDYGSGHIRSKERMPMLKLDCEMKLMKTFNNDRSYEAECGCLQPCSETSYQKTVSQSRWPEEFYQLHMLKAIVQDYRIKMNITDDQFLFKAYNTLWQSFLTARKIKTEIRYNNTMTTERQKEIDTKHEQIAVNRKAASHDIRQNLLRLNIYLEDLQVTSHIHTPAYSLASLLADIGGTLGLWMGISVLTIMELGEMGIRLGSLILNPKRELDTEDLDNKSKHNNSGDRSNSKMDGNSNDVSKPGTLGDLC